MGKILYDHIKQLRTKTEILGNIKDQKKIEKILRPKIEFKINGWYQIEVLTINILTLVSYTFFFLSQCFLYFRTRMIVNFCLF